MINQVEKREGEFLQRGQHSAKAQRQVSLCATKKSWKRYSVWMENIITQIKSCETRSVNRGQITVLYGINKSFMLGAIRSHWRVLSRGATLDLLFRKMTIATVTYESEGNETRSIKCQNLKLIRKTILPQFWNLGIGVEWGWHQVTGDLSGVSQVLRVGKLTGHLKSLSFYSWASIA